MENIIDFIDKNNNLFLKVSLVFLAIITLMKLFLNYLYSDNGKNSSKSSKEKLFKLLETNLKNGLISNKEDIILLLNSINREYFKERNYSLAPVLEDFIVFITEKDDKDEILKTNYLFLKEIINIENEDEPFTNIPDEERRLLRAINDSVKHDDINSIKINLDELNTVLSTRYKIYQKSAALNKWSIIVAVISTLLTVFFGLMSIK